MTASRVPMPRLRDPGERPSTHGRCRCGGMLAPGRVDKVRALRCTDCKETYLAKTDLIRLVMAPFEDG